MFALDLDAYIVVGLLSSIGSSLNVDVSEIGQAVTVFALCYAIVAPVAATFLYGKPARQVLCVALVMFLLANLLSAVTANVTILLFSGLGAGLFSPVIATVAITLVPAEKKVRALGLY